MENKYPCTTSVEDVDLTLRFNTVFQSAKKLWKKVRDFLLEGGKLVGDVKLIHVSIKEIKGEKRLSVYGAGYKGNNTVVFVPISTESRTYDTTDSGIDKAVKQIEHVVKNQADFSCANDKASIRCFIQILSKIFYKNQLVNLQLVSGGFQITIIPQGGIGVPLHYAMTFLENHLKSLEK